MFQNEAGILFFATEQCVEWLRVVSCHVVVCLYLGLFCVCRVTFMCNFTLRFLLLQTFMFYVTFPTVCVLRGHFE